MIANDIMTKVRLYASDAGKSKISDFEIINAINDALRLMAEESARLGGALFRVQETIMTLQGDAPLPVGYLEVIKAFDSTHKELFNVHTDTPKESEFGIKGATLYCGNTSLELWYFGYPANVDDADSVIDLPASYSAPLAKVAMALISNNLEDAVAIADYFMGAKMKKKQTRE